MEFDIALTPENLIILFLTVLVIALAFWVIRIERKLKTLLTTKNAQTLDDSLRAIAQNLEELNRFQDQATDHLEGLERRVQRSIRAVDTIRFNPFAGDGSGGNHSFATAFISESGDGVVISSLYTRERTNIFSKQLRNFAPTQELSEEEQEVVNKARRLTKDA